MPDAIVHSANENGNNEPISMDSMNVETEDYMSRSASQTMSSSVSNADLCLLEESEGGAPSEDFSALKNEINEDDEKADDVKDEDEHLTSSPKSEDSNAPTILDDDLLEALEVVSIVLILFNIT